MYMDVEEAQLKSRATVRTAIGVDVHALTHSTEKEGHLYTCSREDQLRLGHRGSNNKHLNPRRDNFKK
jgi:hypothetical protein